MNMNTTSLSITLLAFLVVIATASAQTISIDSETVIAQQLPQDVDVSVYISNIENCTGIGFNLSFNPNVVNVEDVRANTTYFSNVSVTDYNVNNEIGFLHVAVVAYDKISTIDRKPLVDITFKALNYGESYLNFTFAEYSLEDFNVTDINRVNGTITVQKVFYFNVQGNAEILWNRSYENVSLLEVADLNNDGKDDVVFVSDSGNTYIIYALDGGTGNEMWHVSLGSDDRPYILKVNDLNGDRKKDVIAIAERTIVGIRNDGDELLIFYHNDNISYFSEVMTYAVDVDGDGFKEVVTGGWGSTWENYFIMVIDSGYNNEKWVRKFGGWTQVIASSEKKSPVKIANVVSIKGYFKEFNFDFNKDTRGDIILWYEKNGNCYIEAVRGDTGDTIWAYNTTDSLYFRSTAGDVNGDGVTDLLFHGDEDTVILSGADGAVLFNVSQYLLSSCVDYDHDGICEFITYDGNKIYLRSANGNEEWNYSFGEYDYCSLDTIYIEGGVVVIVYKHYWENETTELKAIKFDDSGTPLWTFEKSFVGHLGYYTATEDLTGDGIKDVLFPTIDYPGYVLAIDGSTGQELWNISEARIGYIGDFNGDGRGDVFNITHVEEWHFMKSGEGLSGDSLTYIFNVSSSDPTEMYFNWFNPFKTYDVNGDGGKDVIFLVNPNSPDSKIYVVGYPTTPMPDLTVEISVPLSIKKGTPFAINVTVKNIGSVTSGSTTVDLYIDGSKVETFNVPQLNAGGTEKFSYTHTFTSEGTYQIKAVVDLGNNVDERNENNNVAVEYIKVYAPKPDLIGILHIYDEFGNKTNYVKIHKAGDAWQGDTYDYPFVVLNATFEIRNLNPSATVTKTFTIEATYRGHPLSTELTQKELDDLNADGVLYMHYEAVINASNVDVGCYTFNITVDSTNAIPEINETNNNASYTVCISQPDLIPVLLLPDRMNPGMNEFTVGVVNIGDVWARETKLNVRIEGTTESNITFNVPILKPGESWLTNVSYDFADGYYNIIVKADADDNEAEMNEFNNTVSKTVRVVYLVVNASVISEVSEAMLGDEFNVSLVLNTTHAIGSLELYLVYDRYAVANISAYSAHGLKFTELRQWPYKVIRIEGKGLDLNGTFNLANITFRVITDKERVALFNLSGKIRDTDGYLMKLNSTNTSVKIAKITDLRPYVYGYRSGYVIGDLVNFSVTVRNLRSTWSNPYVLNVSVYNESGLQEVLLNQTMPPLEPWGWNLTRLSWNTSGMGEGIYWINVSLYNDTITNNNNVKSYNITLKLYRLDAWYMWYPGWRILNNTTFWVGCYVNVTAPGKVNATINVPQGLLVWNGSEWTNSATTERFLWGGKWNWFGFLLKGVKPGEYGNGTNKEINITVTGRDKIDVINSTIEAKPDEWVPDYKLVIYVPKIKLQSVNTTVLSSEDTSSMTFKTIDANNVTTFEQHIRLVVLAGQEGRILRGLDYLVHYPYGCVEQTTSTMLGALHTDWYYRTKGYPDVYDWNKVDESIKAGVESLAKGGVRGQHDNGSWSMWGHNPRGDGFYTMYASYGLGRVAEDSEYGYLVKNNLTETHVYDPAVNKGKFNFNDTIYWFAKAAKRDPTTGAIWWEPWQGTHWFFDGHLPVTSWIMVSHYQLVNEGVVNDTARQIANQTMANVTKYLISVQNSDGGWNQWGDKDNPSRPSDAISTALSVWGLKLYGTPSADVNRSEIENAIERGVAWLLNNTVSAGPNKVYWRHPLESPWWNDYGRRSEATAYALIALNESRSMNNLNFTVLPATDPTMSMGVNYLIGVYRSYGSFGYTAATQAALHALTLLQVVAIETNTLSITIDGVVTKQIEVNATSPKVVVELNASEISTINANGIAESNKKRIHTVDINRLSGNGTIIVSVENEQEVARNEITYGVEYTGHKILKVGEFGSGQSTTNTILIKTLDSSKIAQLQDSIVITPTLPDNMVEGKSYELTVKIENNDDTVLLSPIITVPLGSMSFDSSATPKWYDSELRQLNVFTEDNYNYDAPNNTLYFFPDQIPPNGYIEIYFNATVNAGNMALDVRMTPMYNEEQTYTASAIKYVKGYGNLTINVFNATGKSIDANVIVDGMNTGTTMRILEGKHTVRVERAGYVPVEFEVSLNAGDKKNYTVALYTPEELSQPRVVFAEGMSFEDANAAMSILSNVSVTPNATTKAEQSFTLSVSGVEKKTIAIRVPKYERGSLWAWLNDSVKIEVNGQTAIPKEVGNEKVLLLEIEGGASVNMSFEGRELGEVYKDGVIDYNDAIAILQYSVFKNSSISKDMFIGKAVYGEVYKDGVIDYNDAIAILQYSVFKNTDLNADLWT